MSTRKRLVVLSGGSAANNLIDVFTTLCDDGNNGRSLDFVLPISDNGGSTSEILRVFGGPGIGDVRSRLIRLVPDDADEEILTIKQLLNHRLEDSHEAARIEWYQLVEGTHKLWSGISSEKRELIRSFLLLLNLEQLKRSSSFSFRRASTGNLFLTGARIFFGSFESAIELFRLVTRVPGYIGVIPCINSSHAHHIAAGLEDGEVITGQNQISHPTSQPTFSATPTAVTTPTPTVFNGEESSDEEADGHGREEDANLPGSLAQLRMRNIEFSKTDEQQLPARIDRVWYINPYGHEMRPAVNSKVLAALTAAEVIVYSIGSLWTSLAPILILRHVGAYIASLPPSTPRILLLNGSHDRETSPDSSSFTATEFIRAIARSCCSHPTPSDPPPGAYRDFVTHVIYLVGNGAPQVDVAQLRGLGIEPVCVYGRRHEDGEAKGMIYDRVSLLGALAAILGKRARKPETRRNTFDGSRTPPVLGDGNTK